MKQNFTSIKSRIILWFVIFFVGVGISIVLLLNTLYLQSFKDLEALSVENNVAIVKNEIEYSFKDLVGTSLDWAFWDDTYMFAQGLDDRYIERNFSDENFGMYNVDFIIFMDNSQELFYGKQKDIETEKINIVETGVLNKFIELGIFENRNPETFLSEFVIIDNKPVLVASHPILKTDGSGVSMGNVMFGRTMNISMMEEISTKLGLKTSFELVEKEKTGISGGINGSKIEIEKTNKDFMVGSFYLTEVQQQNYIKINVEMPRKVMAFGKKSIEFLMVLLPLILIATLILLFYFLDKFVLSKITSLNKQVIDIEKTNSLNTRVEVSDNNDEISQLSRGINLMLDGLENLQTEISEANNTLEIKVAKRTNELGITNKQLKAEVIQRQKIQEEITFLAYHDFLTGLPNRLLFTDKMNQGIKQANRKRTQISIMFIDIDGFKNINDTLGHNQGDQLLRQVADRLSKIIKRKGNLCRVGGDEFALSINGYNDEEYLDSFIFKVMDSFKNPFILSEQEYYITVSMGIAQYPADGEDVETLMKNADMVMYEAKALGKNQYQKCSQILKDLAIENMLLTNSLHKAVERNEMMIYYQPQVNGLTGEIVGVEALLRWNHPEFGIIQPSKFIPLAESTRLIVPIGNWVLKTACSQNKYWQDKGYKNVRMAVNFSSHQINDPSIVEQVGGILTELSLNPRYLDIELTESIAMNHNGRVKETIKRLKNLGVAFSIDDFGTEYSSLSRLKELPIDRLKIDMSFVQGIGISEKDEAITKAVILLANTLGLRTIAEGVETKDQLDFLNARGCNEVQGFYLYKPMPAEEMEKLLREIS